MCQMAPTKKIAFPGISGHQVIEKCTVKVKVKGIGRLKALFLLRLKPTPTPVHTLTLALKAIT